MANDLSFSEQRARDHLVLIRSALKELPDCCSDFIRAIEPTTTALTRLAYVRDLRLFFKFLISEVPVFAECTYLSITEHDLNRITANHILLFSEYLSLYIRDDEKAETNADISKMRKLATLRSFFKFLFKNNRIDRNVSQLIDLPKLHDKPILRLEIDEVARMLDVAENGSDSLSERQLKWHEHTKTRDLAMLSLFLGTGIRVSECVGINIDDIDFEMNSFLITRKGGAQVILYFPDEVARVLKDYLEIRKDITALPGHENAFFLSMQKRRITVRATEQMVKKYALVVAPLKKRMSPHKLRSTFGTNLYHETGDIYLVADVLGHSDVNTTRKHYAAMSDDRRRLAAQYVKLRDDDQSQS
ncbi:MAG: tyrosine-type recombinase/integrase [Clostridia bacterium]|nr:tyrosine-type recombinase/integrase [Clostridia bacterium]